jgi:Zn-dependent protease with chaperone function
VTIPVTLGLVIAAGYGLVSLLLSIGVAVAWRVVLERTQRSANDVLALRLMPVAGAALVALTVVLPAFLISEPAHDAEEGGPLLAALGVVALFSVGTGIRRAWRACTAARALLRAWAGSADRAVIAGHPVDLVDLPEPLVAVVGGWQPRIVASKRVRAACSEGEFVEVISHEAAHLSARDNWKLWLLLLCPDPLAWLPAGAALTARWRVTAEREADERATGSDPRRRLALASALIKVARLASPAEPPSSEALTMPIAVDDVEGRVRGLIAPAPPARPASRIPGLLQCGWFVPAVAVPFYGLVHRAIEAVVAFGR